MSKLQDKLNPPEAKRSKLSGELKRKPETAAKITVSLVVKSTKGTLFVDDLSLKQDGKELLKNGSFDD